MQKSIEDCYFFYYSTCSKSEGCPFRHCEKALGSETICKNWLTKSCFDFNCPYRHMMITKNRSQIICYWESTPSGCQKPHCPFFHRLKSDANQQLNKTNNQVIQPQENIQQYQPTTHRLVVSNSQINGSDVTNKQINNHDINEHNNNLVNTCVVTPLIVQMNNEEIDEESDNELLENENNNNNDDNNNNNNNNNKTNKVNDPKPRRDFKNIINSNLTQPKIVSIKKTDVETPELKIQVKTLDEIRKEKAAIKNVEIENINQQTNEIKIITKSLSESSQSDSMDDSSTKIEKRRLKFSNDLEQKPKKIAKTTSNEIIKNIEKPVTTLSTTITSVPKIQKAIINVEPIPVVSDIKTLKIKTLEEIKAEKELKKKLQEQQQQQDIDKSPKQILDEKISVISVSKEEEKKTSEITNGEKKQEIVAAKVDVVVQPPSNPSQIEKTRKLKIVKKIKTEEEKNIETTVIDNNKRKINETNDEVQANVLIESSAYQKTNINVNQEKNNVVVNANNKKLKTNFVTNESQNPSKKTKKIETIIDNVSEIKKTTITENNLTSSLNIKTDRTLSMNTNDEKVTDNDFELEIAKLMDLCEEVDTL